MNYELHFMSCELHSGVTFQTEGVNYRLQDADYSRGIHGAGCRWGGGGGGCRMWVASCLLMQKLSVFR